MVDLNYSLSDLQSTKSANYDCNRSGKSSSAWFMPLFGEKEKLGQLKSSFTSFSHSFDDDDIRHLSHSRFSVFFWHFCLFTSWIRCPKYVYVWAFICALYWFATIYMLENVTTKVHEKKNSWCMKIIAVFACNTIYGLNITNKKSFNAFCHWKEKNCSKHSSFIMIQLMRTTTKLAFNSKKLLWMFHLNWKLLKILAWPLEIQNTWTFRYMISTITVALFHNESGCQKFSIYSLKIMVSVISTLNVYCGIQYAL